MIERTISKDKMSLERLKAFLATHPDWEYVVSEYPAAWHIKIDRGGETLDDELREHEAYPDPRLAYQVEVTHVSPHGLGVRVKRGPHEGVVACVAQKAVGEKVILIFLEGDRSKPIIIG